MFRTLLLGVVAVALTGGAAFGAGVSIGRRGAAPPVQAQGDLGGAGAFGTVDRVEARTLYVTGPNNQQFKVVLTDQTQVLRLTQGSVADITPGSRVTVQAQGQPAADGTLTAAAVSLVPEWFGGQLGQLGQGAHAPGQQGQPGQPAQGSRAGH
ncbi:MAG: hypothetical protein HY332_18935 [Chloroflexi bacterium]|nr:hypothetical protein [Chloroflexota bacterium]